MHRMCFIEFKHGNVSVKFTTERQCTEQRRNDTANKITPTAICKHFQALTLK